MLSFHTIFVCIRCDALICLFVYIVCIHCSTPNFIVSSTSSFENHTQTHYMCCFKFHTEFIDFKSSYQCLNAVYVHTAQYKLCIANAFFISLNVINIFPNAFYGSVVKIFSFYIVAFPFIDGKFAWNICDHIPKMKYVWRQSIFLCTHIVTLCHKLLDTK